MLALFDLPNARNPAAERKSAWKVTMNIDPGFALKYVLIRRRFKGHQVYESECIGNVAGDQNWIL
jgi:hypothetical protein